MFNYPSNSPGVRKEEENERLKVRPGLRMVEPRRPWALGKVKAIIVDGVRFSRLPKGKGGFPYSVFRVLC